MQVAVVLRVSLHFDHVQNAELGTCRNNLEECSVACCTMFCSVTYSLCVTVVFIPWCVVQFCTFHGLLYMTEVHSVACCT